MRIRKRFTALFVASLFGVSASAFADEPLTLTIGTQDAAWPLIVEASHVLDGAPYKVKWAVLTGPAAQLSALYSKVLDVGLMGDTSLIIEQGAVFEGTCKMLQMANAADKNKNNNKKEEPLDTSRMKPLAVDASAPKATEIPAATSVVS